METPWPLEPESVVQVNHRLPITVWCKWQHAGLLLLRYWFKSNRGCYAGVAQLGRAGVL